MTYNLVREGAMPTVPLSEAKTHLAKLLADVEALGEEVIITRSGRPVGVLLSLSDYEGLIETLEILADQDLGQSIRQGLADAQAGKLLGHEDVWDDVDPDLRG
ncbi:MAG: type II toxin-antitoxin system Phd/YefM family antitoxin [Acidobacteria bacterium]|nr:type II toxin-antitoxin system Phd/YefM family antitoxin [Acidobacteriota bacterium]